MKIAVAILVAAITCGPVSAQTFGELRTETPFNSAGAVTNEKGSLIERGEVNGVEYRFYYSDGSGEFRSGKTVWSVVCQKDAMSDKKSCYMSSSGLLILVRPRAVTTISVGSNHYPKTPITIRIGGGKPLSAANGGPFNPQVSKEIVKQLANADTVTTRYMEWPYDVWDDKTFEPKGFTETYSYLQWAVERIK